MKKLSQIMSILGPGLLWAGASIGVSHLVQSTRAGADYGFALVSVVILVNLFKYPFFEIAPRYAASTGHSLLTGYKKLGNWAFYLFLFVTVATMFPIQAVVTLITSGIVCWFVGTEVKTEYVSAAILVACTAILILGHYNLLDSIIKYVVIFLTAATTVAVIAAAVTYSPGQVEVEALPIWPAGIGFIIALCGWMPAPLDVAIWSSIWTTEKRKSNPEATTLKNALFDFNVGYIGTLFVALCFLALGALVMFGSGEVFSQKAAIFSGQLIDLYANTIGGWSRYLIATAAVATMFSTTITCLDAYGRVLSKSTSLIMKGDDSDESSYLIWILVTIVGAVLLLGFFKKTMTAMVDIATVLSFVLTPILAVLNYKVILSKDIPAEARLPKWLHVLSILGIIVLTGFAVLYIVIRIKEFIK